MRHDGAAAMLAAIAIAGCGGGGGGAQPVAAAPAGRFLAVADVQRIVAQAAGEAQARGRPARIAVVDRAGNVLADFEMPGAPATVGISSGLGVVGGLDGIAPGTVPASLAALSKAMTGAYLSSNGNAFSTRTAGQIVREHFNPREIGQPSGPLYGVQFSQLPCSDVMLAAARGGPGPRPAPLGLAADPGGIPLYKDGVLVGGIGVEADGVYGLDLDILDADEAPEERIAVAGATGFEAPADIRGERITADGRTFRFIDPGALAADPRAAAAMPQLAAQAGVAFDAVERAIAGRFPARAGSDSRLGAPEVSALLAEALAVAQRTRAQIRRPLGSSAQVNITVVDTRGEILGFARSADAPVFGIDVSAQKARTALFFSHAFAMLPEPGRGYLLDARAFLGAPQEFTGATAWTTRAIGNLHRPFYPDGIRSGPHGPLSTPITRWSPFNVGFQLDVIRAAVVGALAGDPGPCASAPLLNGPQIFPGGVPIYRGATLVGAIGVSGDGVDQDDMVGYLAVARTGATGLGHAPAAMRADRYAPHGARLRYVQCPQAPFIGSTEQDACD